MDVPQFSLNYVEQLRDRLLDRVLNALVGCTIRGEDITEYARALRRVIPGNVAMDVLVESIRYIAGHSLTARMVTELAWRLAGNLEQLRAGKPVTPWTCQTADEWVPVEVYNARPGRDGRNRIGHTFTLQIMAGSPCPLKIHVFWKQELASMAARRVGFSKPWGKYPYRAALDLVGLRFVVKISQARSKHAPVFHEIADPQPSWVVTWNRKTVLAVRCRVKPCPRDYTHRCSECVVGYDQCDAATHPHTFVNQACAFCGHASTAFDPGLGMQQCVRCHFKELLQYRK